MFRAKSIFKIIYSRSRSTETVLQGRCKGQGRTGMEKLTGRHIHWIYNVFRRKILEFLELPHQNHAKNSQIFTRQILL